jgi:hypothetical protein
VRCAALKTDSEIATTEMKSQFTGIRGPVVEVTWFLTSASISIQARFPSYDRAIPSNDACRDWVPVCNPSMRIRCCMWNVVQPENQIRVLVAVALCNVLRPLATSQNHAHRMQVFTVIQQIKWTATVCRVQQGGQEEHPGELPPHSQLVASHQERRQAA